jgi:hypothetical protein
LTGIENAVGRASHVGQLDVVCPGAGHKDQGAEQGGKQYTFYES